MKKLYMVSMEEAVELLRATKVVNDHYITDNGEAKEVHGFSKDPSYPEFVRCLKNLLTFLEKATDTTDDADILLPAEHTRMVETILEVGKHIMVKHKLQSLKKDIMNSL